MFNYGFPFFLLTWLFGKSMATCATQVGIRLSGLSFDSSNILDSHRGLALEVAAHRHHCLAQETPNASIVVVSPNGHCQHYSYDRRRTGSGSRPTGNFFSPYKEKKNGSAWKVTGYQPGLSPVCQPRFALAEERTLRGSARRGGEGETSTEPERKRTELRRRTWAAGRLGPGCLPLSASSQPCLPRCWPAAQRPLPRPAAC